MSIMESIRDYILDCPFMNDGRVNIDWLGASPTEYSIDGTAVNPVVKRYVDGGALKQFNFTFASVEEYGQDVQNNIRNSGFYEDFAAWLESQSKKGILPLLSGGKKAFKIEAVSTGYLIENTPDKGRYVIQCRLLYYTD